MKETIIADNYYYSRNITPEIKEYFENKLKDQRKVNLPRNSVDISLENKTLGQAKRDVSLIYDFLEDYCTDINIIYDGDSLFRVAFNLFEEYSLSDIKKEFKDKFKDSKLFVITKPSKQIELYRVNKNTGLVSIMIPRDKLDQFNKFKATLDDVFKRKFKDKLDWDLSLQKKKTSKEKVIQDYFKFVHDQIKDMYKEDSKTYDLEDRDPSNFYRQVQKVKKSITQPLVGVPPYRGDLLEYIRTKVDIESPKEDNQNTKYSDKLKKAVSLLEYLAQKID